MTDTEGAGIQVVSGRNSCLSSSSKQSKETERTTKRLTEGGDIKDGHAGTIYGDMAAWHVARLVSMYLYLLRRGNCLQVRRTKHFHGLS